MPDLSIVIPCFNSGVFLPDALDSISAYKGNKDLEIVIVDDGSTDTLTLKLLEKLAVTGKYSIIRQSNKGPGAARNNGVRNTKANYILFLDSDNKIRSNMFIDQGISYMNQNSDVGVYYGNPAFFGDVEGLRVFKTSSFDMKQMLANNYIDMCSMIRKQAWLDVGGLDEEKVIIGHEDWDFWLRIGRTKWKFNYEDAILFDYRVRKDSLITTPKQIDRYYSMIRHILGKQADILPEYFFQACNAFESLKAIRNQEIQHPIKTFIKFLLIKIGVKRDNLEMY